MRSPRIPLLTLLFMLTLSHAPLRAQQPGWERVQPRSTFHLWSVDFFSARRGIAVGDFGVMLGTDDSGRTWKQRLSPNQLALRGMFVFDSVTAVTAGFGGSVFRTTDAGNTWTRSEPGVSGNLTVLAGFGAHVWIAGQDGHLLRSTDRGLTWTAGNTGTSKLIGALSFSDSLHGWCASPEGALLRSNDGGRTWIAGTGPSPLPVTDILSLSRDTVLVSAFDGRIHRSVDGGGTWLVATAPSVDRLVFGRRAGRGLWAVDGKGLVLEGLDGGSRWIVRYAEAGGTFHGITVTPAGTVVGVGERAAVVVRPKRAEHGKVSGQTKQNRKNPGVK